MTQREKLISKILSGTADKKISSFSKAALGLVKMLRGCCAQTKTVLNMPFVAGFKQRIAEMMARREDALNEQITTLTISQATIITEKRDAAVDYERTIFELKAQYENEKFKAENAETKAKEQLDHIRNVEINQSKSIKSNEFEAKLSSKGIFHMTSPRGESNYNSIIE